MYHAHCLLHLWSKPFRVATVTSDQAYSDLPTLPLEDMQDELGWPKSLSIVPNIIFRFIYFFGQLSAVFRDGTGVGTGKAL